MSDYIAEAEYFRQRAEFEQGFADSIGVSLDRLRELADADAEGRVVVLPKIGDRLFYAPYPKGATDLDGNPAFWRNTGDGSGEVKNVHVLVTFDNWMGRIPINRTWKTKQESEADRALAATEPKGDAK